MNTATARAYSNIAFIKYWGNQDDHYRIPSNGSISMNLDGISTTTTIRFDPQFTQDTLSFAGNRIVGSALDRVSGFVDIVRQLSGKTWYAEVITENNFPAGTGIASSASAFAALALAASEALGLNLDERTLSALARRGSGSASRSIPTGFVEWYAGTDDSSSIAESIAAPDHWNLVDIIAIVSTEHKTVGSTGGHSLAKSSPLQASRVDDTPRRLDICRQALLNRDFDSLAEVVEQDSLMMHAVMITSRPALFYWLPATLLLFEAVTSWRRSGLPVCFTTDAGPNVHIITTDDFADEIRRRISEFEDVKEMRRATPGKGTHLLPTYLNPPDD